MKIIGRFLLIVLAYCAATFAAALVVGVVGFFADTPPSAWLPSLNAIGNIFASAVFFWLYLLLWLALLPFLLAIVFGELISVRSPLAYIALNVLDVPVQSAFGSAIIVIAGALGAAAYWRVAGRYAGIWRET